MKQQFVNAFLIGIAVVAIAVAGIMYMQRGAHMELTGAATVRTVATDENTSLALLNLHITNPADYGFQIGNVTVTLETDKGVSTSNIIARADAKRLFDSMPENGPFYPALYFHYTIPPRTTTDYTVAAQFSLPEKMLKERKRFVVRVEEVNGKFAEFTAN